MNFMQNLELSASSSNESECAKPHVPVAGLREYFSQSLSDRKDADMRIARCECSGETAASDWLGL